MVRSKSISYVLPGNHYLLSARPISTAGALSGTMAAELAGSSAPGLNGACNGAAERAISTPSACGKPKSSSSPLTDDTKLNFGVRGASDSSTSCMPEPLMLDSKDSHVRDKEARASNTVPGLGQSSGTASNARQGVQRPAQPAEAHTAYALRERLRAMVLGHGERPVASGMVEISNCSTYGFVVALREAAGELWRDHEEEIKLAAAPRLIDEVDLIGLLAADVRGRPLLHEDDSNGVGKRVLTHATRASKAIKDAEKRASDAVRRAQDAAAGDPSKLPRLVAAEAKAEADVLAVHEKPTPKLELPTRTVGKRGLPLDPTAEAEAQVAAARAAVKRAQSTHEAATIVKEAAVAAFRRDLKQCTGSSSPDDSLLAAAHEASDAELRAWEELQAAEYDASCAERARDSLALAPKPERSPIVAHDKRACFARLWRPRGVKETAVFRRRLQQDARSNDLCSCNDPRVPSWLCRVAWCWTTAAGCLCSERRTHLPGEAFCLCVVDAWGMPEGEHGQVTEPPYARPRTVPSYRDVEFEYFLHRPLHSVNAEVPLDEAAATVTPEQLSSYCLSVGYPDPYERGVRVDVPGHGPCVLDLESGRIWPVQRF